MNPEEAKAKIAELKRTLVEKRPFKYQAGMVGSKLEGLQNKVMSTNDLEAINPLMEMRSKYVAPQGKFIDSVKRYHGDPRPWLKGSLLGTVDRSLNTNAPVSQIPYDYAVNASRALDANFAGRPMEDLAGVGKKVIKSRDWTKNPPTNDVERVDADHYPSFNKGPLFAYDHQLEAIDAKGEGSSQWLFSDHPQLSGRTAEPGLLRSQVMEPRRQVYNRMLPEYGKSIGIPDLTYDSATNLTHQQQSDFLKRVDSDIQQTNPGLYGVQKHVELKQADAQKFPMVSYGNGLGLLRSVRNGVGNVAKPFKAYSGVNQQ